MAFWLPLAMMGAGILKNELVDKPQAKRMAQAEAVKTAYSPWTGMQGQTVQEPSSLDAGLKWGATGLMLGQGMKGMGMGMGNPFGPTATNANTPMAMNYTQQQSPWQSMMSQQKPTMYT